MTTNNKLDASAYTENVLPALYKRHLPIKYNPCLSHILSSNSKKDAEEKESFFKKLQKYASQIALILSISWAIFFAFERHQTKKELWQTKEELKGTTYTKTLYEELYQQESKKHTSLIDNNARLEWELAHLREELYYTEQIFWIRNTIAEQRISTLLEMIKMYKDLVAMREESSDRYQNELHQLKKDYQNILNKNIGLDWADSTFTDWETTISLAQIKFLQNILYFDENLSKNELIDILAYLTSFNSTFPNLLETLEIEEHPIQITSKDVIEETDSSLTIWQYNKDSIVVCKDNVIKVFPHELWHFISHYAEWNDVLNKMKDEKFPMIYQYCTDHQMELWLSEYEISTPEECFAELYAIFFNMYILNQEEQFKEQFGEKIASFMKEFTNTFIKAFYKKDSNEESQAEESQKIGTVE